MNALSGQPGQSLAAPHPPRQSKSALPHLCFLCFLQLPPLSLSISQPPSSHVPSPLHAP
jgi:hypothetical protein